MYVCYIDESGTPDLPGNTSHFVLAGLAIPIAEWKEIDSRVVMVLDQYGLSNAEFHTAWILRRYLEQSRIPDFEKLSSSERRQAVEKERIKELLRLQKKNVPAYKQSKKNFDKSAAYIHLTFDERVQLVRDVADLIGSWGRARLFAEAIDKTHFNPSTSPRTIDEQAFEQVISRFEQYMVKAAGTNSFGILVHDNNETVAKKHTALMRQFHSNGTLWTKIHRIIDTPLFVNSSLTSMVQMADLCAYALRRYFENNEKDLLERVLRRADRVKGTLVGVRHFSDMKCECIVCRGHRVPPAAKRRSVRRQRYKHST